MELTKIDQFQQKSWVYLNIYSKETMFLNDNQKLS